MKRVLAALVPRTLSSRLIVVAALSLLIAQAISFSLLMREGQQQWRTLTAAPAVLRILDFAENDGARIDDDRRRRWERVEVERAMPILSGEPAPDIAARAADMFANAGMPVMQVRAYIDEGPVPPPRVLRLLGHDPDARHSRRARLRLAVQLEPDRWLVAATQARYSAPPVARRLIVQTILIYAAVLLPLLWIGRRLSAPLGTLTRAARDYEPDEKTVPLAERGPHDIRDLTHAFNLMRSRIGAMLAEKDHMLGAIGHDLRTPLASLRVRVESMEDPDERAQMIATIEDMRQMLDDILALARVGRDRQPPQALDLGALVEAVAEDFAGLGADITVTGCDRAVVRVRPPALRRALRNLIDNAVKYGERARLSVLADKGQAIVRVEDDGPGIAPDRIGDMLEPFTRLEESRSRETGGSGLGLALVRAVMRAEGGAVRLSNRTDGTGLVAELILPLAAR